MECSISAALDLALAGEEVCLNRLAELAEIEAHNAIKCIGEVNDIAIVKHRNDERWQMILPDVSGGEAWRLQSFDARGFSGHMVFRSKTEAVRNAAQMRFTVRDDEALDRMQDTPAFQEGLYVADQLSALNRDEISYDEFLGRVAKYREEHSASLVL